MNTLEITKDGTKIWENEKGQLHREDGPAVIWPDGTERWYLHNQFHRIDGPAVIYPDGRERWYLHNQLHRIDGPAIIDPNGHKEYWIDGRNLTKDEWFEQLSQEQRFRMAFKLDEL